MATDIEDRGTALENEYFYRKERELLAKMKANLDAGKRRIWRSSARNAKAR